MATILITKRRVINSMVWGAGMYPNVSQVWASRYVNDEDVIRLVEAPAPEPEPDTYTAGDLASAELYYLRHIRLAVSMAEDPALVPVPVELLEAARLALPEEHRPPV